MSENLYKDLGFENPELELFKANICVEMQKLHDLIYNGSLHPTAKQAACYKYQALGYVVRQQGHSPAPHLTHDCIYSPSETILQINAYE